MDYALLNNRLNEISGLKGLAYFEAFFDAWGFPKATLDRIKLSKNIDIKKGLFVSNKAFIMDTDAKNLYGELAVLQRNGIGKLGTRFIILSNDFDILALDLYTFETLQVSKKEVDKKCEFFFPLIGREKFTRAGDSVSISVAERLASVYNGLMLCNGIDAEHSIQLHVAFIIWLAYLDSQAFFSGQKHHLAEIINNYGAESNEFFMTVLYDVWEQFCYEKGSNLKINYDCDFGKVIFPSFVTERLKVDTKIRKDIGEILLLDWENVSPEVLGAILQEVASNGANNSCYTTSENIHKLIGSLFIDALYDEYEVKKQSEEELLKLLDKVSHIDVLDPACGAGNYLIVTYKEINKLIDVITSQLKKLGENKKVTWLNIHGIEEDAFATIISRISIMIAVHQESGEIVSLEKIDIRETNPLNVDWDKDIPQDKELYIIGNPPYKGAKKQTPEQIKNKDRVFCEYDNCKELDYAACWFLLASKVVSKRHGSFAFVTTNSLTQGQQVGLLWPKLFDLGVHISFAYRPFKWRNDAKNNTAVTVVILGIASNMLKNDCELFDQDQSYKILEISPYLTEGNVIVYKRRTPISDLPLMDKGNMPYDNGQLLLSPDEHKKLIEAFPMAKQYCRRVVGSDEFINGIERWCLWINDDELINAMEIPPIKERIDNCREFRKSLKDAAGRKLALRPHQFREIRSTKKYSLVIPSVSSERRPYIPIGFIGKDTIVTNLSFVIYDCEPWVFGVIASKMHNLWFRTVCGGLETRLRYSSQLGYNTFPFPKLDARQKREIGQIVLHILSEREKDSEKTLAEIYDPDKMSVGLKYEHSLLDLAVERCYKESPFTSDQERLNFMFAYYKQMMEENNE